MATATAVDPQELVLQSIKKVTAIATLPEVTSRIVAIVEDPKSSASQLHKIVAHDPALVTRILKVVNSAFYGLPGQIGSVERAIVMLGLNAVKNLAIAASLGQLFRGVTLCEGFTAKDLWTHCIAVAVASRELARQLKVPILEEAFLVGMIHDLGTMVELQVFPKKLAAVCQQAQTTTTDFCQIERDIIGADHQQLGAAMAEQWKFPHSCQLVAGYHHRPSALPEDGRLLVTLVYVADTICCQGNHGFNLTALHQNLDQADLAQIQLDQALIAHVIEKLPELLSATANLLA
jgi:putative nucleotidyltransferase with HDIG domain